LIFASERNHEMRQHNSAIVDSSRKTSIKKYENKISSQKGRKKIRERLSRCTDGADIVGLSRWAITDRTGRQILCFKRKKDSLEDDLKSELISAIWYNMFLENRQHYLIERVWAYMTQKNKVYKNRNRMQFVFTFNDGVKGEIGRKQDENNIIEINISKKLIKTLDKKQKINSELSCKSEEIIKKLQLNNKQPLTDNASSRDFNRNSEVMNAVRTLFKSKMMDFQRAGIKRGILLLANDSYLYKCFKLLYEKEINAEKTRLSLSDSQSRKQQPRVTSLDSLYFYELAAKFLFMWQNIAILCPTVRMIHLFTYISENRKKRSSICLFFCQDAHKRVSLGEEIFNVLSNIESHAPKRTRQYRMEGEIHWRWTKAYNKLSGKRKEKSKKAD